MVGCLLLLTWCMAILVKGHAVKIVIVSKNQQPATDKNIIASKPTRMKIITNTMLVTIQIWSHYTYCSMYEQWFDPWLYDWSSFLPVDEKYHITNHVIFVVIHHNSTSKILYITCNNLTIIYAANTSQHMVTKDYQHGNTVLD